MYSFPSGTPSNRYNSFILHIKRELKCTLSIKSQLIPIFLTFLLSADKSGEVLPRFLPRLVGGATVEFAEGTNGEIIGSVDETSGEFAVSSLRDISTCVPVVKVVNRGGGLLIRDL